MENKKIMTKFNYFGAISLIFFPFALIVSFGMHHFGEFTHADLLTIKYTYQPPERFMEMFMSKSPVDFVLPHLIIYLALPLAVSSVLYLGSFLYEKKHWMSITGISVVIIRIIFMGGVFGSWLSFSANGNIHANHESSTVPVIWELVRPHGMLMMTSLLAGLCIIGFMVITAVLIYTRTIPRHQSILIFTVKSPAAYMME